MSLLRPYESIDSPSADWIATQLGIKEEEIKLQNMYQAASNPSAYLAERSNRLNTISEQLKNEYDRIRKELNNQGLPEDKKNHLLTEIMKSQFSVEKALMDNAYEESDMILFRGMTKNLTHKDANYSRGTKTGKSSSGHTYNISGGSTTTPIMETSTESKEYS